MNTQWQQYPFYLLIFISVMVMPSMEFEWAFDALLTWTAQQNQHPIFV